MAAARPAPPTTLLLPGLACDAALWRHQQPALAALGLGPVVVPTAHLPGQSLAEMAQRLLQAHPGPLLLAGCSMGAMLALACWQQAGPGRILGLALVGSTARPDSDEMKALRTEAIGLFAQGRAEELLRANLMFAFHRAHAAAFAADYLAMVLRAGTEGLIRQNRAVMQRDDLRPVLATVRCPTLVVGGLDDQLTPPDCQREMAQGIAGARLHLLAECGHMVSWEQAEALSTLLCDWRRGLASGSDPALAAGP